jgi:hypothetical protein
MPKGELHVQLNVNYADDDKLSEVSRLARLLYVDALCLCKRTLNDGVLTAQQVKKLCYPAPGSSALREAAELVASNAWLLNPDGTYTVAACLKRNKSRAKVADEQAARAEEDSRKATYGNHIRWHEQRGITKPDCTWCTSPGGSPPDPPGIATRSPGESPTIPIRRSETETETETETEIRTPGARETHDPQRAADLAATTHSPAAHRLVEAYAATCPHRPPSDVLSGLAAEVDKLRAENIPPEHIAAGLDRWGAKPHLTFRLLPRLVHEAVNARPASSPSASSGRTLGDKAADWLALAQQPPALRAIPGGAP